MTAPRLAPLGATAALGAALSCVTGIQLTRDFSDFHALAIVLLGYTVSEVELTQPLVRARLRVKALELWPQLGSETGLGVNRDNWKGWLSKREERYGATLSLPPR